MTAESLHNLVKTRPLLGFPGHTGDGQLFQLGGRVIRELQALALDGDMEDDLHLEKAGPGSAACPHLPQQHSKCVHICRLAELTCISSPIFCQLKFSSALMNAWVLLQQFWHPCWA